MMQSAFDGRIAFKDTMASNFSLRYAFVNYLISESESKPDASDEPPLVEISKRRNLCQLDHFFLDEVGPLQALSRYFSMESKEDSSSSSRIIMDERDKAKKMSKLQQAFVLFLGSIDYMKYVYANLLRGPLDRKASCMSDPLFGRRYAERALVGRDARLDLLFRVFSKSGADILSDALAYFPTDELEFFRKGNSKWLKSLLISIEELSLSVSILSSDRHRDYPFIYCNKEFQILSGYPRSQIIGQPFDFLSGGSQVIKLFTTSSPDSLQRTNESRWKKMSRAFEISCPVSVSVTNRKRDGSLFSCIISGKPIYDRSGTQRYIICVHYEKKNVHHHHHHTHHSDNNNNNNSSSSSSSSSDSTSDISAASSHARTERDEINEIKLVADLTSTLPNLLDT